MPLGLALKTGTAGDVSPPGNSVMAARVGITPSDTVPSTSKLRKPPTA